MRSDRSFPMNYVAVRKHVSNLALIDYSIVHNWNWNTVDFNVESMQRFFVLRKNTRLCHQCKCLLKLSVGE